MLHVPHVARCPAAPVLASDVTVLTSASDGTVTITPLSLSGTAISTEIAASVGTQGFTTTVLTRSALGLELPQRLRCNRRELAVHIPQRVAGCLAPLLVVYVRRKQQRLQPIRHQPVHALADGLYMLVAGFALVGSHQVEEDAVDEATATAQIAAASQGESRRYNVKTTPVINRPTNVKFNSSFSRNLCMGRTSDTSSVVLEPKLDTTKTFVFR